MTLYKYTVPIKCSTLYHIKNKIFHIVWRAFQISLLALMGAFNGIGFYILFNFDDVYAYSLSVGGSSMPGFQYFIIGVVLVIDTGVLSIMLDECDIQIKLDCVRENKE